MVDGGNAITRLIKTVELELKMFRACNFSSGGAQFESSSNAAACAFRENGPNGPTEPGPPPIALYPNQLVRCGVRCVFARFCAIK